MKENLQNMPMVEVLQSTKELSRLRLSLKSEILGYYEVVDKREQHLQSDLTIVYIGLSILAIILVSYLHKLIPLLFWTILVVIISSIIFFLVSLFRSFLGSSPAVAPKSEHSQGMTSSDNSSPPSKAELENKESPKLLEAQNKPTIRLEILTPRKGVPVDTKKQE